MIKFVRKIKTKYKYYKHLKCICSKHNLTSILKCYEERIITNLQLGLD